MDGHILLASREIEDENDLERSRRGSVFVKMLELESGQGGGEEVKCEVECCPGMVA